MLSLVPFLLLGGCEGAPSGLHVVLSSSQEQLTADGRSTLALTLAVTRDGAPEADGALIPLTTTLGTIEVGPVEGGVAQATLQAGTVRGTASLGLATGSLSGQTEIALIPGETVATQLHLHGSIISHTSLPRDLVHRSDSIKARAAA